MFPSSTHLGQLLSGASSDLREALLFFFLLKLSPESFSSLGYLLSLETFPSLELAFKSFLKEMLDFFDDNDFERSIADLTNFGSLSLVFFTFVSGSSFGWSLSVRLSAEMYSFGPAPCNEKSLRSVLRF